MKIILHCLLLLTLGGNAIAQKVNLVWAKHNGGSSDEYASAIVADANKNIYTTGTFYSTADFDPGPGIHALTSSGQQDIFIQKLDADGNLLWVKKIGSSYDDVSTCLSMDQTGSLYVAGHFSGTVSFNPETGTNNLTAVGEFDGFILKLDSDGNFIWVNQFGGSLYDSPHAIGIDAQGNVYHTGYFFETSDFDPGPGTSYLTAYGQQDAYLQKLDKDGNFVWVKQMGGIDFDMGYSLAVDNNNVHVLGQFTGSANFDAGTEGNDLVSDHNSNDIFIQKFDADGNSIWVKQIGGAYMEVGQALTIGLTGDIFVTGRFYGTVDFDPGSGAHLLSTPTTTGAAFVLKFDNQGNFNWAKQSEGIGSANAMDIKVDQWNEVYLIGEFDQTVDFDPGSSIYNLSSNGSNDSFILKLDVNGNFILAKHLGGSNYDAGISIEVDADDNIYTLGYFRSSVDFNPNAGIYTLTSAGQYDIFIRKLSQCTTVTDVSTITSGTTITANTSDATYQWLSCDQNYTALSNENAQSFTAMDNGNYAVEISLNGCIDTSECVNILTTAVSNPLVYHLYSNTIDHKIILETGSSRISEIMIFDTQGRTIYSLKNFSQPTTELAVEPGLYVGQITMDNKVEVIKFLVE